MPPAAAALLRNWEVYPPQPAVAKVAAGFHGKIKSTER